MPSSVCTIVSGNPESLSDSRYVIMTRQCCFFEYYEICNLIFFNKSMQMYLILSIYKMQAVQHLEWVILRAHIHSQFLKPQLAKDSANWNNQAEVNLFLNKTILVVCEVAGFPLHCCKNGCFDIMLNSLLKCYIWGKM